MLSPPLLWGANNIMCVLTFAHAFIHISGVSSAVHATYLRMLCAMCCVCVSFSLLCRLEDKLDNDNENLKVEVVGET